MEVCGNANTNERMSQLEKEVAEFDYQEAWNHIFQRLKNESSLYSKDATVVVARKPCNRNRNRYRDISPFDHSRVRLSHGDNDYINASLVEMPEVRRRYILTQGPLPSTCGHFWQMVWEADSKAIVMLNRIVEKGVLKCHPYFPIGSQHPGGLDELVLPDVGMRLELRSEEDFGYYVRREFDMELQETGAHKSVTQWHYLTWPDFGVPRSPGSFLNFLMAVRRSGGLENDVGPPVVHCSAGVGRSGTFALVDTALKMIVQADSLEGIDMRAILLEMRRYRHGLIYTADQLRFSYLAVLEGGRGMLAAKQTPGTNLDELQFHVDDADMHQPMETPDDLSSSSDPDEEIIMSDADRIDDLETLMMHEISASEHTAAAAASEDVAVVNDAAAAEEKKESVVEEESGVEGASIRQRHSNNNAHNASRSPDPDDQLSSEDSAAILRSGHLTREARQRRRNERKARTQAIVSEIKQRMAEQDLTRQRWKDARRWMIPAGIALAVSIGGYVFTRVMFGGQAA